MMILPIIRYNCIINLNLTRTQNEKFKSLSNRVKRVTTHQTKVLQIENERKRYACLLVRKCMDGTACCDFNIYFKQTKHRISTRNNGNLLQLPKVKLNVSKNSFYFMGAKLYNDLPLEIRKEASFNMYKRKLKEFYQ